tara:strand:- start:170 stop:739 length:570 start_codon:yes stop_codon:yes gene_type:complete
MPISKINLTSGITGTMPVANGGTGLASGTSGQFLKFTGSTTVASAAVDAKLGQVINAQFGYVQTNSTSFTDTGLTADITPSATSSKVLVLCSLVGCYVTAENTCLISRLVRGSTEILQTESIGGYTGNSNEIGYGGSSAASYLDSPSTTSATTYKIQFATRVSNNVSIGNWQSGSERGKSTITLIEVLA